MPASRRRPSVVLLALVLWLAAPISARALEAEQRAVAVDTPGAHLAGTLLLPASNPDGTAVLILPGSGAIDRNGNGPRLKTDVYRLLAERLADCGVASLRYDKRGVGASTALDREAPPQFGDMVADAGAWLEFLERRTELRRLYLLGHSQGGLIAALLAEEETLSGLLLVATAGRPLGAVLRDQLDATGLSPALRERAGAILAELEQGRRVTEVPPELHALFRPEVQDFLIEWLRLDPEAVLAGSDEPALVVQGGRDLQASQADAERLAGARPGVRLVLVADMNHVLKQAPAARAANLATYDDAALPLAPGLVAAVQDFIGCRE